MYTVEDYAIKTKKTQDGYPLFLGEDYFVTGSFDGFAGPHRAKLLGLNEDFVYLSMFHTSMGYVKCGFQYSRVFKNRENCDA